MAPASISSIFNGRTNPTINHVNAIHRAFPQVNTKWLIFGEGAMMSGDGSENNEAGTAGAANSSSLPSDETLIDIASDFGGSQMGLFNQPRQSQAPNSERTRTTPPASSRDHSRDARADMANNFDIRPRKVKEIRVFYDDNTYESFTPQSK